MSEQQRAAAAPASARRLASVLICAHFFALLTAVTGYSAANFPAPPLAVLANGPVRPYLHLTLLGEPYRFFAPNPGTPTVLWFRVQYQDRAIRWVEAPRPQGFWPRMPYQRRLNLTTALAQQIVASPEGRQLTDIGQICLTSYARHVGRDQTRVRADGTPEPVKTVGVYCLQHFPRSPAQVRAGWEPTDLRTYQATFAGAFNPDGERTDEFRPRLVEQPIESVTAGILEADVYPLLRRDPDADPSKVIDDLAVPGPVHRFLTRHPELLKPGAPGEAKRAVERLLPVPPEAPAGTGRPGPPARGPL